MPITSAIADATLSFPSPWLGKGAVVVLVDEQAKVLRHAGLSQDEVADWKRTHLPKTQDTLANALGYEGIAALWLRTHQAGEVEYARDLRTHFAELGRAVAPSVMNAICRNPDLGTADRAIDVDRWHREIVSVSRPHLSRLVRSGAETEWGLGKTRTRGQTFYLLKEVQGGTLLTSQLPSDVAEGVKKFTDSLLSQPYWRDLADGVRQEIADEILRGLDAGRTRAEIANRVERLLGANAASRRALLIARTEATGAINAGQEQARLKFQETGRLRGMQWLTTIDDRTREDHRLANNQYIDVGEEFYVGGERCKYPGDTSLSPAQRCNCRCTSISILKSNEELADEAAGTNLPSVFPPPSTTPPPPPAIPEISIPAVVVERPKLPAPQTFTGQGVTVDKGENEVIKLQVFFGAVPTDEQVARMVGAPPGAKVNLMSDDPDDLEDPLSVDIEHPDYTAFRSFKFDPVTKELVCENVNFFMKEGSQGQGLGTSILATQVEELAKQGINRLEATAARGEKMNGYYTWPRLGYDGPLRPEIIAALPLELSACRMVSDLMRTEAGRAWWKENGETIDLVFDTREGSQSRQILEAYHEARKALAKGFRLNSKAAKVRRRVNVEELELSEEEERILDTVWSLIGSRIRSAIPPSSPWASVETWDVEAARVKRGKDGRVHQIWQRGRDGRARLITVERDSGGRVSGFQTEVSQ